MKVLVQYNPFIMLCLGPIGVYRVTSELFYKGTILQRDSRKMPILCIQICVITRCYNMKGVLYSLKKVADVGYSPHSSLAVAWYNCQQIICVE